MDLSILTEKFLLSTNTSDHYLWILILGVIFAFITAYGIGANDVANAFGSSVGSKALKIWQALIIAGIFEFLGALFLGAGVTKTIRKGIADIDVFQRDPEILMYGMMCVLISTAFWLIIASYFELPVSTTHSVVGGVIGMAMAAHGSDAVVWYKADSAAFPPFKGVSSIVVSWVLSPVFSGLFALIIFLITKYSVLIYDNSFIRTWFLFPILVLVMLMINTFFIIYKGAKSFKELDDMPLGEAFMWSVIVGVIGAIIVSIIGWFVLKPRIEKMYENDEERPDNVPRTNSEVEMQRTESMGQSSNGSRSSIVRGFIKYFNDSERAVHGIVETDEIVKNVHECTRVYNNKTEESFKYLQVFTAICDSFAHGANDVANSIGPFAAIWGIYEHNMVSKKSDVPKWILAFGGIGIAIGLGTYGYNIIRAIGVKLSKITPTRGYAIELGAALVIIMGSRLEIPLSTTHCQVGATVGVGIGDSQGLKGVNWRLFFKVIFGWVITLLVTGFGSALLFSMGAYAPGFNEIYQRNNYEEALWVNSNLMIDTMNTTLPENPASWTSDDVSLNKTLHEFRINITNIFRTPLIRAKFFVPQFEDTLDTFSIESGLPLDFNNRTSYYNDLPNPFT